MTVSSQLRRSGASHATQQSEAVKIGQQPWVREEGSYDVYGTTLETLEFSDGSQSRFII